MTGAKRQFIAIDLWPPGGSLSWFRALKTTPPPGVGVGGPRPTRPGGHQGGRRGRSQHGSGMNRTSSFEEGNLTNGAEAAPALPPGRPVVPPLRVVPGSRRPPCSGPIPADDLDTSSSPRPLKGRTDRVSRRDLPRAHPDWDKPTSTVPPRAGVATRSPAAQGLCGRSSMPKGPG